MTRGDRQQMRRQQTPANAARGAVFVTLLCLLSFMDLGMSHAIDGATDISQVRALKGGVSGGDAPGFPVTLTQPGLYRLTSNLDVRTQSSPADVTAIEVAANDVTIDMNGFELLGPVTCSTSSPVSCTSSGEGLGISVQQTESVFFVNTVVKNGTVRGFGNKGIRLRSGRIERVRALHNGFGGFSVGEGEVVDCIAIYNQAIGINVGSGAIRRSVSAHGGFGIYVGSTHVQQCIVEGNEADGIVAETGAGVIDGCQVTNNLVDGIRTASFFDNGGTHTIRGNTITGNGEAGVRCGASCTVVDNTIRFNAGLAIQFSSAGGYARNVMTANNGGSETQVDGGIPIGPNVCGSNATCP